MALNYEINAKLRLDGGAGFERSMGRLSSRVRAFANRLRGAQTIAGGLFRTLLSFGAGYFGFQAITGAIGGTIRGMLQFQREVEATQIGLQSIISAVDGISFDAAGESARRVWSQLAEDALRTTATTQDLFDIFQGIVGPIRAAGSSMDTVRQITNSTVAAATALGVDLAQAQRDIGLMVRGTAGMDTRMFALLRSMGLITEETQEWNRNLTTEQRIERLQRALGNFDEAASAYGHSFAGVTSSMTDIVQQLSSAFARPIFERVTRYLQTINEMLLANRDSIESFLSRAGTRAAAAFSEVADQAFDAARWIIDHWDEIASKVQEFGNQLREQGPQLARVAAALTALSTLRSVLAPILTAVSSVMTLFEGGGLLSGLFGGGAAGAGAAGGAGGGAGAGAGGGAAAALGPIAVVFAAVAGAAIVLYENLQPVMDAFAYFIPVFEAMWADVQAIGIAFWEVLRPVLKIMGTTLLVTVVPMILLLIAALRGLLIVLRFALEVLAWVSNAIEEYLLDPLISAIVQIGAAIAGFVGDLLVADENVRARGTVSGAPRDPRVDRLLEQMEGEQGQTGRTETYGVTPGQPLTPEARPHTVNNFHRGSVQVRQEFREADPDRVMVRMIGDIDAQAERRTQSGFAPALTR